MVDNVTGTMLLDFNVIGTSLDPHFAGRVNIENARVPRGEVREPLQEWPGGLPAGCRSRGGGSVSSRGRARASARDHQAASALTRLKVGDLEINVNARSFQVLRNEFGTMEVDVRLELRGIADSPIVEGKLTVTAGELKVDEILDRGPFPSLFHPGGCSDDARRDCGAESVGQARPQPPADDSRHLAHDRR